MLATHMRNLLPITRHATAAARAGLQVRCMASDAKPPSNASRPISADKKKQLVFELIAAKEETGKTFTEISKEIGLTNAYTAQLFYNQAQLKAGTVDKLRKAVPGLTDEQVSLMQRCPMRSWDPQLIQEPHVYRLYEAVMHYGEAIKAIMNEEAGDGIESAIDCFLDVKVIEGKAGEKRMCVVINGKFLPHIEQQAADNTAPSQYTA